MMQFRPGDRLKHRATRDEWSVAVTDGSLVYDAGGLPKCAPANDFDLVVAADDASSRRVLEEFANMRSPGEDPRRDIAKRQLHELRLVAIGVDPQMIVDKPRIVCLCGSTRFKDQFVQSNLTETLEGHIVLSIGCDTKTDKELRIDADMKEYLDHLHLAKIKLADEVLVLNVGGYIGKSTRREIDYAELIGKPVRYLEALTDDSSKRGSKAANDTPQKGHA